MAQPEFKLGLALAGAITAGAYTAGVIDFLTEALEDFETERGQDGVPGHRVGIKVVAGALAGAITGAIGLIAMTRGVDPQALSQEERAKPFPIVRPTTTPTAACCPRSTTLGWSVPGSWRDPRVDRVFWMSRT